MPLNVALFSQNPLNLQECFAALTNEAQGISMTQERGLHYSSTPAYLLLAFCHDIATGKTVELKKLWAVVARNALQEEGVGYSDQNQQIQVFYEQLSAIFPLVLAQKQQEETKTELRKLISDAHNICYDAPRAQAESWKAAHIKLKLRFAARLDSLYSGALMHLTRTYLNYFANASEPTLYRELFSESVCRSLALQADKSTAAAYETWYKFEKQAGFTDHERKFVDQTAETEIFAEQEDGLESYTGFGSLAMHYTVYLACIHHNPERIKAYEKAYAGYAQLIKLLIYFEVAPLPSGTRIDSNGYIKSIPDFSRFTNLSPEGKLPYDIQATLIRLDNQYSMIDDNFMSKAKIACQAQGLSAEKWRAAVAAIERQQLAELNLPRALAAWAEKHAPQPRSHSSSSSSAAAASAAVLATPQSAARKRARPTEESPDPWDSAFDDSDSDDLSSTSMTVAPPRKRARQTTSTLAASPANGSAETRRLTTLEAQVADLTRQLQTENANVAELRAQVQALQQQQQLQLLILTRLAQIGSEPAQIPAPAAGPGLFQATVPAAAAINGAAAHAAAEPAQPG